MTCKSLTTRQQMILTNKSYLTTTLGLSCYPGSPTPFNNNNNIKIRYLELLSLKELAFAFLVHKETYSEIHLIKRY